MIPAARSPVLTRGFAQSVTGPVVEEITATPVHPFYVKGRGFVEAGDLGIGTEIVTRAGPELFLRTIARKTSPEGILVYNFEVEQDHTYFVGLSGDGVWVHNAVPCAVALTGAEKDLLRAEARDIWAKEWGRRPAWDDLEIHHIEPLEYAHILGGNPNRVENLVAVDKLVRQEISAEWTAFRTGLGGRGPTAGEVRGMVAHVDRNYGGLMIRMRP